MAEDLKQVREGSSCLGKSRQAVERRHDSECGGQGSLLIHLPSQGLLSGKVALLITVAEEQA